MKTPELLMTAGRLNGRRFQVPEGGLRLGRSSANDISIPDEGLSRNHCLIERSGENALRVIDLGSANGTYVNGEAVGNDAVTLVVGDVIEAGENALEVVGDKPAPKPDSPKPPVANPAVPEGPVDLGLAPAPAAAAAPAAPRRKFANVLWALTVVIVGAAIGLILWSDGKPGVSEPKAVEAAETRAPGLAALSYEKVEADATRVFRYHMTIEGDRLRVRYDDVPGADRHVDKSGTLGDEARARLVEILSSPEFEKLDAHYSGMSAANENALTSWRIHAVFGDRVKDVLVENVVEPEAFRDVREALEAFSRNELGIWAIQYSKEKLVELSATAERSGDAKWDEREVEYGNLSDCIRSYREAMVNLETVNPKPEGYAALREKLRRAEEALAAKYRDQAFVAEKAVSLGDWEQARRELRTLCDLVPDRADPRHATANAKLLDVENRLKTKGGKGK